MRFNLKGKSDLVGKKRVIRYFALFPVTIDGDRRWLETVEIEQEYKCYFEGFEDGSSYSWENMKFLN